MIYSREQVQKMLIVARNTNNISIDAIISDSASLFLPEDDEIIDAAYDNTIDKPEYDAFIDGANWVVNMMENRAIKETV